MKVKRIIQFVEFGHERKSRVYKEINYLIYLLFYNNVNYKHTRFLISIWILD